MRAIVLRRNDTDQDHIDKLTALHDLKVVYTVTTDSEHPKLVVMIAAEHAIDHRASAVVIPWLTADHVWSAREWHALAEFLTLVDGDGAIVDAVEARP